MNHRHAPVSNGRDGPPVVIVGYDESWSAKFETERPLIA